MGLQLYRRKRNFSRTLEPAGRIKTSAGENRKLKFVVQKHAATRLHYDFRLEMQGVLKSWAVPKGFPTTRGDRRLAIEVEDHPLEYGNFEGIIPAGNYGAGTVMVWDSGFYQVYGEAPEKALKQGKLHLVLHGKKLKGEWTLVRIRASDPTKPQWLLMKTGTDIPAFSERAESRSVVSSRTLEQIASGNPRQWESNRSGTEAVRSEKIAPPRIKPVGRTLMSSPVSSSSIAFVEPMKARLVKELPKGENWLYEIKFDGVRALAIKNGREVRLVSRAENDFTAKYSSIVDQLKALSARDAILDGEIVALDDEGRPKFQLLQCYDLPDGKKPPLFYYVFDLLRLNGRNLQSLPLTERKKIAGELIGNHFSGIRFSGELSGSPDRLIEQMQKRGLEGLIAKQRSSKYEPGKRSGAWLKYKWTNEQEFVIAGYTQPKGGRAFFGAILVGYYKGNQLIFAAKVGTGFDHKLLSSLFKKFQSLRVADCPFANLPEKTGLSKAEMRRCTWVRPELVCQIRFAEWTRDGHLRQPAFSGLREDKPPKEVIREE